MPGRSVAAAWDMKGSCKDDGFLSLSEFALAQHFIKMKLAGQDLPASLPPQMVPPPEANRA